MTVSELIHGIPGSSVRGRGNIQISGVALDSRKVERGDLFVALSGANMDGRRFAEKAVARGAAAVASDQPVEIRNIPVIVIPQARRWLGALASRVYGEPSRSMTVVGITGTNGKTTTAHLIESILTAGGRKAAYVGTTAYRWRKGSTVIETDAPRTSPEAPELQKLLRQMHDDGTTDVVIECSSHGLELGRLNEIHFDVAVFTNLTPDHLDFHQTMGRYEAAKWRLFSDLLPASVKQNRIAVVNLDDAVGARWISKLSVPRLTYSHSNSGADIFATKVEMSPAGLQATIQVKKEKAIVRSSLIGLYNLSNLLAAVGAGAALGLPLSRISAGIERLHRVPGRLEAVANPKNLQVLIDYAHTEDAITNVLETLLPLRKRRLIVIFGCGGDRDRLKRPRMGEAVTRRADVSIVTSDNPRTEEPASIVEEILSGIPMQFPRMEPEKLTGDSKGVVAAVTDRREAIRLGISIGRSGDIILIAGKGHETVQEIRGVRHPFSDREVARELLEGGKA
ncbi:MAG TPA: UDP-N-acetylmuramoyl-L-alanyl-D-glutamate--2,6-diaminopimelate ligase [Bdellovibrionota bacterium]|nr:UDP-N-acetylmuramoyl-L-alanyl-D-glutamate--2,6-diaminopimelate ligase [Bdellovibrionota bacterium]